MVKCHGKTSLCAVFCTAAAGPLFSALGSFLKLAEKGFRSTVELILLCLALMHTTSVWSVGVLYLLASPHSSVRAAVLLTRHLFVHMEEFFFILISNSIRTLRDLQK